MDDMDRLVVYLRNLNTDQWTSFTPLDWVNGFRERVYDALDIHAATFGGTISMTGTPERGRITVFAKGEFEKLVDYDWHTLTLREAQDMADLRDIAAP